VYNPERLPKLVSRIKYKYKSPFRTRTHYFVSSVAAAAAKASKFPV
jgi:hypothetical protein